MSIFEFLKFKEFEGYIYFFVLKIQKCDLDTVFEGIEHSEDTCVVHDDTFNQENVNLFRLNSN